MAELNNWNITAASNNSAPPDGWPENTMQYSEVNDTAREGMAVIARYYKDTNGTLVATGTANSYAVTLNAGYAAYFAGMRFACQIPATNTGASTINVNIIGAIAITNRDGSALGAGQLQAGGIYEFVHDGVDFQLVGSVAGSTIVSPDVNLRTDIVTATPPTSEAVTGAFEIYDADGSDLLARVGYAAGSPLFIQSFMQGADVRIQGENAVGTMLSLFTANPGGSAIIYHTGLQRIVTGANGVNMLGSSANAPSAGTSQYTVLSLQNSAGVEAGYLGYQLDAHMRWHNDVTSGRVYISATNSGSGTVTLFFGDPNAGSGYYIDMLGLARVVPSASGGLQANNTVTAAGLERVMTVSDNALKADLASPTFTGFPAAPTASVGTNNTQIATTAYVVSRIANDISVKANLASPTFTGVPAAPTAVVGTNTTQLATTAFVVAQIANDAPTKSGGGASGTWGISITGTAGVATQIGTAVDTTDTLAYPLFVNASSGNQAAKTNTGLSFNATTGALSATSFVGNGAGLSSLDAGNISAGTLAVARGGTGTTTSVGTGSVVLSSGATLNNPILTGTFSMNDNTVDRAHMNDFSIDHQAVTSTATTTINYTLGQSVALTMSASITTFSVSNWPTTGRLGQIELEIIQAATALTITWPAAILWAGGTAPDISTVSKRYLVSLRTYVGGTTILGSWSGPY